MDLGLNGSVAVVYAASRGLGLASAQALAAEGCDLAILARDATRIEAAAARIRAATGRRVLAYAADVSEAQAHSAFAAAVQAAYGRCDIVVLNSGGPKPGTFDALDEDAFRAATDLLLLSAVRGAKAFLPLIRSGGRGGRIITLTSTSVREVLPNLMLSNSLRAAVTGWAKTLARELGPEGITVNCVAPGTIATERIAELIAANAARQSLPEEAVRQQFLARIPAGRFGRPEEFAAAVAFLASQRASFISGTTVVVDAAQTATVT
jgi:3-oxoacyl-[acyl-carrier protein] reductase